MKANYITYRTPVHTYPSLYAYTHYYSQNALPPTIFSWMGKKTPKIRQKIFIINKELFLIDTDIIEV